MMALADIQKRYRELGRLRMGATRTTDKGKVIPTKLDKWRLTCHDPALLEVAATVYGGTVQVWENAPNEGENYELFTNTDSLDIVVPPGYLLSQDYELWSGGGCLRRCDGHKQKKTLRPCACPSEFDERIKLAAQGKACSPHTRLSVMLPAIPDLGVWRLETHGYNAAEELQTAYEILRLATENGSYVRAQLRIEQRSKKKPDPRNEGKFLTVRFAVPVIAFAGYLMEINQALGEDGRGQLPNVTPPTTEGRMLPSGHPELSTAKGEHPGIQAPSLPSAPAPASPTPQDIALPKWLVDMPGDDGLIIDVANAVAGESGATVVMQSLQEVAANARTEKAQQEIRRRVVAQLDEAAKGTPEEPAPDSDWEATAEVEVDPGTLL